MSTTDPWAGSPDLHPERAMLADLAGNADPASIEISRSLALGAALRGRLLGDVEPSPTPGQLDTIIDEVLAATSDPAPLAESTDLLLTVVVPAYNEAENLPELWARLGPVFDAVGPCELVVVDDGSTDDTWNLIRSLASQHDRVRGVRLTRNFGHQAALAAGMAAARGRSVCLMDADLQDPPELLPEMLAAWGAGSKVVYGVRRRRQEHLVKRAGYRGFYRIYRRLADIDVPLDSGDFALMDRRVVDEIMALPEHNRFLRGLRSWVGHEQSGLEYERPARHAGQAKYSFRRLVRLALDGLVSFSSAPLRVASWLGVLTACAGGVYIAFAVIARFAWGDVPEGWTSIIAVVLIIGGIQLLVIGLLGEYVARIYDETKSRPNYLVEESTPPHRAPPG